jgi:hypothetical protein
MFTDAFLSAFVVNPHLHLNKLPFLTPFAPHLEHRCEVYRAPTKPTSMPSCQATCCKACLSIEYGIRLTLRLLFRLSFALFNPLSSP